MRLVINIPDKQYNDIVEHYNTFPNEWKKWGLQAIKNGTPLPKGHGRLIDESQIKKCGMDFVNHRIKTNAPTIIEAVNGGSEETDEDSN